MHAVHVRCTCVSNGMCCWVPSLFLYTLCDIILIYIFTWPGMCYLLVHISLVVVVLHTEYAHISFSFSPKPVFSFQLSNIRILVIREYCSVISLAFGLRNNSPCSTLICILSCISFVHVHMQLELVSVMTSVGRSSVVEGRRMRWWRKRFITNKQQPLQMGLVEYLCTILAYHWVVWSSNNGVQWWIISWADASIFKRSK